jgi:hypothetical protein
MGLGGYRTPNFDRKEPTLSTLTPEQTDLFKALHIRKPISTYT